MTYCPSLLILTVTPCVVHGAHLAFKCKYSLTGTFPRSLSGSRFADFPRRDFRYAVVQLNLKKATASVCEPQPRLWQMLFIARVIICSSEYCLSPYTLPFTPYVVQVSHFASRGGSNDNITFIKLTILVVGERRTRRSVKPEMAPAT